MKLQPELVLRLCFLITIVIYSSIGVFAGFGNPQRLAKCSAESTKEVSIVVLNMENIENE